jgi:hypothetical protein
MIEFTIDDIKTLVTYKRLNKYPLKRNEDNSMAIKKANLKNLIKLIATKYRYNLISLNSFQVKTQNKNPLPIKPIIVKTISNIK